MGRSGEQGGPEELPVEMHFRPISRLPLDVEVCLTPLGENLVVGPVGFQFVERLRKCVVQRGVSLQRGCSDLDGSERVMTI